MRVTSGDDAAEPATVDGPDGGVATRGLFASWLKSEKTIDGIDACRETGFESARRSAHSGSGGPTLTRLCVRRETSGATS